jgi:very-short-patch-repair endonuclease
MKASPLVGEVGGGPAVSAAEGILHSPPPNPPHEGEGLRRLTLRADAIGRARSLRRRMTDAERVLWRALREALPGYHWRKQVPLGRYFADFASHSAKLIIEVDGGQHADTVQVDEARTSFLEAQGYRVLRFWNNDVQTNIDGVLQHIGHVVSKASPLVGEVGGGRSVSADQECPSWALSARADNAPAPNPPHKGEGR